jgi:hypothetical protein
MNGNTIPSAKQFRYLGSIIQENGSSELDIKKKKINETKRDVSMLNLILWNRNILNQQCY